MRKIATKNGIKNKNFSISFHYQLGTSRGFNFNEEFFMGVCVNIEARSCANEPIFTVNRVDEIMRKWDKNLVAVTHQGHSN